LDIIKTFPDVAKPNRIIAKRPPVEETANFLQTLLENHGANYLEKLFGKKARDALAPLGGPQKVAIALSGKDGQTFRYLDIDKISLDV
jgi:hypothetical protein